MAEVKRINKTPEPPPPEWELKLTDEEAQTLFALLGSTGGTGWGSGGTPIKVYGDDNTLLQYAANPRTKTDAIFYALEKAGFKNIKTTSF